MPAIAVAKMAHSPDARFTRRQYKPRISGTDHAIWRRIKLIPFIATIPEEEQDKTLPDKLRDELPGILPGSVLSCSSPMI